VLSTVLVAGSGRGSVSPSHFRAHQFSPLRDDRINEVHLHQKRAQRHLSVAVQCGKSPPRPDFRTAVVHCNDLEDALHSAMPQRQLKVVQQFVAESVVPTLAQCALTPVEHALVCSAPCHTVITWQVVMRSSPHACVCARSKPPMVLPDAGTVYNAGHGNAE
jgi:hypothetical protein